MAWLPDGEKIRKFIRFDATHADRQTPHDGVGRAYALHRAAKMHSFFETRCRYIYLQHTHTPLGLPVYRIATVAVGVLS